MEVGDYIYCYKDVVMHSGVIAAVAGKLYKVSFIGSSLMFDIINENNHDHTFRFKGRNGYYNEFFCDVKILRKQKLKKINNSNL